jgi:hypothetical protein
LIIRHETTKIAHSSMEGIDDKFSSMPVMISPQSAILDVSNLLHVELVGSSSPLSSPPSSDFMGDLQLQNMIQDVMDEFYSAMHDETSSLTSMTSSALSPMVTPLTMQFECDISIPESYSSLLSAYSGYSPSSIINSPPLTPLTPMEIIGEMSPMDSFGPIRKNSVVRPPPAEVDADGKKIRNHHCLRCSSSFFSKYHLRRHEKIHSPDQHQYQCVIPSCRFKSYRSDNLKNHTETHRNRLNRERNDVLKQMEDTIKSEGLELADLEFVV